MSKIKAFTTSTGALGQMIYRQPRTLMTGQIVVETKLQVRVEGLDEERVENYAQLLRDGQILPAIKVFQIEGKFYVVDGFHRLESHRRAGLDTIECLIEQGTFEQAFDLAAEENLRHGLGLSDESKKHLLEHYSQPGRKWHTASTRVIAAELQVGHSTISRWKAQLYQMGQLTRSDITMGMDGKTRDVSGIREAAKGRPQSQMLEYTGDDDEDWQEEREQLNEIEAQLIAERDAALEKLREAEQREKDHAENANLANGARWARITAESHYKYLDEKVQGLRDKSNSVIAIKQQVAADKAKRVADKLAYAARHGWVDADQAELHQWEEMNPYPGDYRLRNVVTGEIWDPHSRPVDLLDNEIKQVEAAERAVTDHERVSEENERKQKLRNHFNQWMSSLKLLPFFLPNDFIVEIYSEDAWALKDMVELKIVELMRFWKAIEGTIGSDNATLTHALHAVLEVLDEED